MNEIQVPGAVIDRLRTNLAAAEIAISEADLAGMIAKGFLTRVVEFEVLAAGGSSDGVPDYLHAWGDPADLGDLLPSEGSSPVAPLGADVAPPGPPAPNSDATDYPTLLEIAGRLARREVSPVELTEAALARILAEDGERNAFQLVLADEARAAAQAAEVEIAAGGYRGPLHGVPLAVKDLLAMRGTATTAGSKILAERVTDYDAAAVECLRAAGAILVGKTRMSEFAYSPGSNNGHYGPTPNPWNPAHDTGGSSSGSAAAVAAGLVFGALGSDTGGSIRIPAAQCGLVGLKPTFGRVSLHGAVTLSWSLDHLGPLTRMVADAAILLAAIAGHDPRDPRTRQVLVPVAGNLQAGVRGLRVGVLGDDGLGRGLGTPEVLAAWHAGLDALAAAGAELVPIDLPQLQPLRVLNGTILGLEAITFHERWLRTRLGDYGEFMRQRILHPYAYGPGALVRAQQLRGELRQACMAIFAQVDVLSTPTLPTPAPALGTPASLLFTSPFNALGWPAISVPVGRTPERLPLGLQLVARPWDGATILRAAQVIEAAGVWPGGRP